MRVGSGDWLKWGWVVGCLLIALFRLGQAKKGCGQKADLRLLALGLLMTVAADFAMVICGKNIEGLYCFLAVQLFYFLRLARGRREKAAWLERPSIQSAALWGISSALWAGLLLQGQGLGGRGRAAGGWVMWQEPEVLLGLCYFVLFTGNVVSVWKRRQEAPFFTWGLVLFWLCDLHVGLLNLGRFMELPNVYWRWIRPYSQAALWVFYLPSQVLISFSSCNTIKSRMSG